MSIDKFVRNIVTFGFGFVLFRFVSFLLTPIYTRYLTIEEYGLLETVIVFIQALLIFMNLGMSSTFIRFCKEKSDQGGREIKIQTHHLHPCGSCLQR